MLKPIAAAVTLVFAIPANAETVASEKAAITVETVAVGLDRPWGVAVLPGGGFLVTEKEGNLRPVSAAGEIGRPVDGVPKVDARGQGGLLDIALDPKFADNRLVYLAFSEPGPGGNSTAVARGRLNADATALEGVEIIFSQKPKVQSVMHYGSRLVFDRDGNLFVTLGERSNAEFREQAQDLRSHLGKVVRIRTDGSVPDGNPFAGRSDALPEIWTYGHRNVQAAALDPATGDLVTIEHGPRGGDELNLDKPGLNFGWPLVSYGVNYDGSKIGAGRQEMEGMMPPLHQWTPVIAPSGMVIYDGAAFPGWQGNILVGGLRAQALVRLERNADGTVKHEERLLEGEVGRVRDVVQGPQGELYLLTDAANGRLVRLSPAKVN
jgi:glucose/arabinose dehydrogenase